MDTRLDGFCLHCLAKFGHPERIDEETLAEEFASFYQISSVPQLFEIRSLVEQTIGTIEPIALPSGLPAFNFSYKGVPSIQYDAKLPQQRTEHSIFHEVFELLQAQFKTMHMGYEKPEGRILCRKADRFAGAVLMQRRIFGPMLIQTGFDMIFLRNWFGRAYSAIPIRAKQLLPEGPDFFVAIYSRLGKKSRHPGQFRVFDSIRSDKIKLGNKGFAYKPLRYPRHLMPKRGDKPPFGGIVEEAIKTGQSFYLEKVTGFDFWHFNDLSVLARPVTNHNCRFR